MSKKPTTPFGSASFGKDGTVTTSVETLSDRKTTQEAQVAANFVAAFNVLHPEGSIDSCTPLPEDDHDFRLSVGGREVNLQITELVQRSFAIPVSRASDATSKMRVEIVAYTTGAEAVTIDTEARDAALSDLIERKQQKHYSKGKGEELWLLVFTTDSAYAVEYGSGGVVKVSPALTKARTALAAKTAHSFDQIWFTNLQTRPIRVWPAA